MHLAFKLIIAAGCIVTCTSLGQGQATRAASSDQIRAWVSQLDDGRFEVRKSATRQLVSAGGAAIVATQRAIETNAGLEVQSRGLEVLEQLARSDQVDVRDSAQRAVGNTGGRRTARIAERAARKLEELKDFRRGIAITELQRLGADIHYANESPMMMGMSEAEVISVKITDQFQGTEEDIQQLRHLFDLRMLVLEGTKITDRFLEPVGHLEELSLLFIKGASVTDAGLKHLERISWLGNLAIWYTPITDAANATLANLRVRDIQLFGTQQSTEGIAQLRQQLLGTPIEFKAGGFLGVGPKNLFPEDGRGGCSVGEVKVNSAAYKAGMQVGDLIVRYDGKAVTNFEQLKELIARNGVGEKVAIEFLRNRELQRVEATLGAGNNRAIAPGTPRRTTHASPG